VASEQLVALDVQVIAEAPTALYVRTGDRRAEGWIPLREVRGGSFSQASGLGELLVPVTFARAEGLLA
jgi:hypothetical protein